MILETKTKWVVIAWRNAQTREDRIYNKSVTKTTQAQRQTRNFNAIRSRSTNGTKDSQPGYTITPNSEEKQLILPNQTSHRQAAGLTAGTNSFCPVASATALK